MIRVGRVEGLATTIEHVGQLVPSTREGRLAEQLSASGRTARAWCSCVPNAAPTSWRAGSRRAASSARRCTPTARRASARRPSRGSSRAGTRALIATDIAARGIDIDDIAHVVNYEVPGSVDTYVHRVGRTGRAETAGTAVTLVAPEELPALRSSKSHCKVFVFGRRSRRRGSRED